MTATGRSIIYLRLSVEDGKALDTVVAQEQRRALDETPGEPINVTTSEAIRRLIRREANHERK